MKETRARMISISQCMYGFTGKDTEELPAREPTTFMTNMPALSVTMYKKWDGQHKHVLLDKGSQTKKAQCRTTVLRPSQPPLATRLAI